MKINLQGEGPWSTFPVKFLNTEFINVLNEIYSIFHECDDSCLNDDDRQLYNVLLSVTENDVRDYSISLKFDFGTRSQKHPEYIHCFIEQSFSSFDTVIHVLKDISENIKTNQKNMTLSSESLAGLILRNFYYRLRTVICLDDGFDTVGVLTTKDNKEGEAMYKKLIPQWVTQAFFNISYTDF